VSKSKEKLEVELQYKRQNQIIGAVALVIRDVVKWGVLASIFYFLFRSIQALAGRSTQASIDIDIFQGFGLYIFQNSTLHEKIEYVVIVGLLMWGLLERKLRQDAIKRLQGRSRELESRIDPNRTSSRLTRRGTTNPGDQP